MISSNDIKLDLSWISKYRSEIFGISIIAIIIFHFRDDYIKSFYVKRFKRVLIPYVLVVTVFWLIKDVALFHLGVGMERISGPLLL